MSSKRKGAFSLPATCILPSGRPSKRHFRRVIVIISQCARPRQTFQGAPTRLREDKRNTSAVRVFSTRVGNANAGWNSPPLPLIACPILDTGVSGNGATPRPSPDPCSPFPRGQALHGWFGLEPRSTTDHSRKGDPCATAPTLHYMYMSFRAQRGIQSVPSKAMQLCRHRL